MYVLPNDKKILSFIPEYFDIKNEKSERIRKSLLEKGILDELQKSLYQLISLYGECPLKFLYDSNDSEKHKIDIGDFVKITDGVFVNFSGKVVDVNHEKGRVSVLVSIFGRETRVDDLEFWQVEEVSSEPGI